MIPSAAPSAGLPRADRPEAHGLTQAEAAARLAAEGANAFPGAGTRSIVAIFGDVLREPMLALLLGAGAIYLALGEMHDAIVLVLFAGMSIGITIVQEARTERAIELLRNLGAPNATVFRDGERRCIPSRDLVRGDVMVVNEGERIPADGWVLATAGLQVDEAVLTGESVPVAKSIRGDDGGAAMPQPGGEGLPCVFAGTLAVRGVGIVEVTATGPRSQLGRIGQSLTSLETEVPRLTQQTRRLVRWFAAAGLGVSLLAVLLFGLLRGGWLDAVLSGIALAMSMLPEELPVVLALFMTMGALRMSRIRVLARRGTAIETLGAATVLCTDKTGTLTENSMVIAELRLPDGQCHRPQDGDADFPAKFADLAGLGILACLEDPFDPMEKAFHDLARHHARAPLRRLQDSGWTLRHQYPLAPELPAMTNVWGNGASGEMVVATKGAPEAIAGLCGLSGAERAGMEAAVEQMAARGLRVLALAEAVWTLAAFPEAQRDFDFVYRGLVGLVDPIRASVPDAVRQLREAGIRVVMITGDYPATASAIAAQAGIPFGEVMSGSEIAALGDADLAGRVDAVTVFARVLPEQKLRIVRALKAAGEVVAMTGDGVNDAPSLKAAHIGIAMGKRGTDVAREASSIVLLDDDFSSIVAAVRLGRRIYDNLRKATAFIFAVHLPIGGLALVPLLAGWPLILGPIHIALLEMVIDPVCSLAFEAEREEANVMRRPPRSPESPLVSRELLLWSALQGLLALFLLVGLAIWANSTLAIEGDVRIACFAGLIAAVLVLVFANRSFHGARAGSGAVRNVPLAIILVIIAAIALCVVLVPGWAALLHFGALGFGAVEAVLVLVVALSVLLGLAKRHFEKALIG